MASISQKVKGYLGGVSKQPDVTLATGQVLEATNAYPDPTFGLIKRPGTQLIDIIGTGTEYTTGKWFDLIRDNEAYIGCIVNGSIKLWNSDTGAVCTVTPSTHPYLTGTYIDFSVMTVQDYTFITNSSVVVNGKPAGAAPTANSKGTVVISVADYDTPYSVSINGVDTPVVKVAAATPDITFSTILNLLKAEIQKKLPNATITVRRQFLDIDNKGVAFSLEPNSLVSGGYVTTYQDTIKGSGTASSTTSNVANVPESGSDGQILQIVNSSGTADDIYVRYDATAKVWKETIKPGISTGLDASTMPHLLKRTALNTFTFGPATWADREVGDDESNPQPSFVGSTINSTFFYSNRLGILSEDNVIFTAAGEYFNFYHTTATTQTAADPIDVSVSSTKAATLRAQLPTTQGLVLFSERQQFLLSGGDSPITPTTARIRTISNYEMDDYVDPVDLGTEFVFISKTPSYTRVMNMKVRGMEEDPEVQDIGRVVADWIPKEIDQLRVSPQNEFVTLAWRDSPDLYVFRSYRENDDTLLSAWVKWKLPGNIKYNYVLKDHMVFVIHKDSKYFLCVANINQGTNLSRYVTPENRKVDPRLDLYYVYPDTTRFSYDPSTRTTKVYTPFPATTSVKPMVVTIANSDTSTSYTSGYIPRLVSSVVGNGSKWSGYYVVDGDLTTLTNTRVVVGFTYNYDVELPTTYYRNDNGQDYTASLTIARYKFSIGLSGEMEFYVKTPGRADWQPRSPISTANYSKADYNPITDSTMFTIPIHQRSLNHSVRLVSDSPFPTSLVSMTWEGVYTPRYYSRR